MSRTVSASGRGDRPVPYALAGSAAIIQTVGVVAAPQREACPRAVPRRGTNDSSTQVSVVPSGATASAIASSCCRQVKTGCGLTAWKAPDSVLLEQRHHPGRHVADVDDLCRRVLRPRCEAPRRPGEPGHPPREPPGVVVRAHDVRRPHQQGARPVPVDGRPLAQHLQPAVRLVGDLLDGRVVELGERGVLGEAGAVGRRVRRDAGHQQVVAAAVAERVGQRLHLPREVGTGVDRGVPLAVGQRRQVAVAVAEPVLDLGEQVRAGPAAVEERDVVPARRAPRSRRAGR